MFFKKSLRRSNDTFPVHDNEPLTDKTEKCGPDIPRFKNRDRLKICMRSI